MSERPRYMSFMRHQGAGVEKFLGELEAEIMGRLWERASPATVRDVLAEMNAARPKPVAYTTVMTVMSRLAEKGVLERVLVGQSYQYRPAQARDEFLRKASGKVVAQLVDDFGDLAIAGFLDVLQHADPENLDKLRRHLDREAADE